MPAALAELVARLGLHSAIAASSCRHPGTHTVGLHSARNDVHHTAHGIRTIEQRGRTAQDFHPLGHERMVGIGHRMPIVTTTSAISSWKGMLSAASPSAFATEVASRLRVSNSVVLFIICIRSLIVFIGCKGRGKRLGAPYRSCGIVHPKHGTCSASAQKRQWPDPSKDIAIAVMKDHTPHRRHSSATVVEGPWPGRTSVSGGRVSRRCSMLWRST